MIETLSLQELRTFGRVRGRVEQLGGFLMLRHASRAKDHRKAGFQSRFLERSGCRAETFAAAQRAGEKK